MKPWGDEAATLATNRFLPLEKGLALAIQLRTHTHNPEGYNRTAQSVFSCIFLGFAKVKCTGPSNYRSAQGDTRNFKLEHSKDRGKKMEATRRLTKRKRLNQSQPEALLGASTRALFHACARLGAICTTSVSRSGFLCHVTWSMWQNGKARNSTQLAFSKGALPHLEKKQWLCWPHCDFLAASLGKESTVARTSWQADDSLEQ